MAEHNVYESLIAAAGTLDAALNAPKPPRDSAAVVLWRHRPGDGVLEVYWVRRSPKLRFMGGWHAFPGGGLSRHDAALPVHGHPEGLDAVPPQAGAPESQLENHLQRTANGTPGIAACLLRELFEETGLLLTPPDKVPASFETTPEEAPKKVPASFSEALAAARKRLLDREARVPFAEILKTLGAELDASALVYAGRWLTPPVAPIRFDNRFFLLEWPATQAAQPTILPGELVEGEWIEPAVAVERWRRGEVITSPPILHLLKVLAADGPTAGLDRLRVPEEANLGPFRRVEFRPGVVLLPLKTPTLPPATHTNCYLLGDGEVVVVDPGSPLPRQIAALRAALEAFQSQGGRLRGIWLTHHHPDHIGGVATIRDAFALPVSAHPATAQRLADAIPVDHLLEDGDRHRLGAMTVAVHHTPGHARGHLCFHDETGGSLLAGDLVAGIGTIVVDPPEGNMDDYLDSLERMAALAPRTLFPAHGPVQADAVGYLRGYLRHRHWREERIVEAWGQGVREIETLVPQVYDDVPAVALPLAQRQLLAHLERLRRQGRLED